MHMESALISVTVGGAMWAASSALAARSAKKLTKEANDKKVPLMAALGAFVFAAQMLNFTIPGTGSSGHLCGGMILAILLGPQAAFLTLCSVLAVQSLIFADGGLLALGCNIFNMAFWTCFVAYPLIYKRIAGDNPSPKRRALGAILASIVGLQFGAFSVVLETSASGISALPFTAFALQMQPIHLGIGIVEGLATAAVVLLVCKSRPEILKLATLAQPVPARSLRPVLAGLAIATVCMGGVLSWFASVHPDGLEWAIYKTSGTEELAAPGDNVHATLAAIQEKTAFLAGYGFNATPELVQGQAASATAAAAPAPEEVAASAWPAISAGTSLSGLLGGAFVLALAGLVGAALRRPQPAV